VLVQLGYEPIEIGRDLGLTKLLKTSVGQIGHKAAKFAGVLAGTTSEACADI
jgi:hypothetical protein